ncbi:endothelin-converting enzyme homolog [Acropora palmata]|uniref:endothelin-converting enzyme homolog n=1 Tax=Acropora palmata TaxID=6131 RepID=UPI003DA0FC08
MGNDGSRNNKQNDDRSKINDRESTWGCRARFLGILGVLTIVLVVAVVHVATSEERKTYFDELLSTGGAIRSARYVHAHHKDSKPEVVCETSDCQKVAKYINASMDYTKDPCVDFFDYVCGGWIKANPIPKSSSTYSTFAKLNGRVERNLRHILEKGIKSSTKKLFHLPRRFYESCMDLNAIEKIGDRPLRDLMEKIGSWRIGSKSSWSEKGWSLERTLLEIHKNYTSAGGPLFSVHISDDPLNNTRHIIEVDQSGPSLSREVYFDSPKIMKAYKQFIIDVGKLLGGDSDMAKRAEDIIEFERKLAKVSVPDADKTESWFNRMTIDKLQKEAPGYPWMHHLSSIFSEETLTEDEEIIIPALSYLQNMSKIIRQTPKRTLANYIVWNVIQDEVSFLSKPYRDARTKYRERVLGSKGQKKRWKTCVTFTNELLGDILGSAYVEHHFSKESKKMAEEMIVEVRSAFKDNVNAIPWMDNVTKTAVMDKADAMRDEVGFPHYLVDKKKFKKRFKKYDHVDIRNNSLFHNRISILKMAHERMLGKLRKPVDKEEWPMDPQTINAMYSFNENEIIIPAAILQQPFFYVKGSPRSLSFGAIGSILGHELTHGFDNTGRKFNKNGELTAQWWSQDSLDAFSAKAKCVENQYSMYKVRDKYPINGKLTLGENIADNGGFKASFRAYKNWLKKNGVESWRLPGVNFTSEQLFFVGFGQAYCSNSRPTEQYLATLSDRHSEEKFRVIGTLSNSYEFSKAFNCKPNTPMNPTSKCAVWCKDGVQP